MTYLIKTKPGCVYCNMAKAVIADTGEAVVEQVYATPVEIANFKAEGYKTFPQIFRDGQYIGGYEDLVKLLADNEEF